MTDKTTQPAASLEQITPSSGCAVKSSLDKAAALGWFNAIVDHFDLHALICMKSNNPIETICAALQKPSTDDAFDSMNDFRLQEIAVLKSEIGDLVKALEYARICLNEEGLDIGFIDAALAKHKQQKDNK